MEPKPLTLQKIRLPTMNPFFFLPPETAHKLALWGVKNGLAGRAKKPASLRKKIGGMTFTSPVGLSAGADKEGVALRGWSALGFGFVEAGTVTMHPRDGNPAPRVWRQPSDRSVINWMGLPGGGLQVFLKNLKAFRDRSSDLVVGVSVASPEGSTDDLETLARECAPYADYFTLNASCPNVAHGDDHDPLDEIKAHIQAVCKGANGLPVLLKLGPTRDKDALIRVLDGAMASGCAGFVLTNTVPEGMKDLLGTDLPFTWPQHNGAPVGGYSGPRLLDTTAFMIKTARAHLGADVPLIGVGGIQSALDALRIIEAGANLVQLYTGFIYKGPQLIKDINRALSAAGH